MRKYSINITIAVIISLVLAICIMCYQRYHVAILPFYYHIEEKKRIDSIITKLLWNDPLSNVYVNIETTYNASLPLYSAIKNILDEWCMFVAQHTNNAITLKINHVACGNKIVVVDCTVSNNNFTSGMQEYIFIKNIWDTILLLFPQCTQLYLMSNDKPFPFQTIGHYLSQSMIDSIELLNDNVGELHESELHENNCMYVALMHNHLGNIFDSVFEKNIYQKYNINNSNKIIISKKLPIDHMYYAELLQSNESKNICFISCYANPHKHITLYVPDNDSEMYEISTIMTDYISKRRIGVLWYIMYKKIKTYCHTHNISLTIVPARHTMCNTYALGETMAIEIGVSNALEAITILNDILT